MEGSSRPSRRTTLVVLAVVAVVAAGVAVPAVLIGHGGGSSGNKTLTQTTSVEPLGPIATSPGVLATIAKASGSPIYWLGPESGYTYELTRTRSGNVYVRYLPAGAKVGNRRATYRVVGTYPYVGALAAVKAAPGARVTKLPRGGVAVTTSADPKSVHLAYPGLNYEIEVYDPVPGRALATVVAGRVLRVG
ncbi:MAG TPA: hypothetical protein VMB53_13865 [Gaiellaceae bacterium]|nr:hypothetical protein [Gaiellaceae bacterium]